MMCEVLGLEPDGLRFVATDGDDGEEGGAAELKDGGFETVVTEENKDEYVALLAEAFAHGGARRELAQFLAGWWEIVPLDALSHADLNESDLGDRDRELPFEMRARCVQRYVERVETCVRAR